jgi:hypothetical protein
MNAANHSVAANSATTLGLPIVGLRRGVADRDRYGRVA